MDFDTYKHIYIIKSKHAPDLYLTIKNKSSQQNGLLCVHGLLNGVQREGCLHQLWEFDVNTRVIKNMNAYNLVLVWQCKIL